jgi:hypothetical protein
MDSGAAKTAAPRHDRVIPTNAYLNACFFMEARFLVIGLDPSPAAAERAGKVNNWAFIPVRQCTF